MIFRFSVIVLIGLAPDFLYLIIILPILFRFHLNEFLVLFQLLFTHFYGLLEVRIFLSNQLEFLLNLINFLQPVREALQFLFRVLAVIFIPLLEIFYLLQMLHSSLFEQVNSLLDLFFILSILNSDFFRFFNVKIDLFSNVFKNFLEFFVDLFIIFKILLLALILNLFNVIDKSKKVFRFRFHLPYLVFQERDSIFLHSELFFVFFLVNLYTLCFKFHHLSDFFEILH